MRPFLVALVMCVALGPAARAGDVRFVNDAPLHAVQFVDPRVGWAAGDDGVLWHTIDGGGTWELQLTSTRASLRSLHFLDTLVGWAAGREELAGGGSVGVLLYTRDGGETWHRVLANALPGVNQVRFADPKTGYLLCDGSDQYPTGVFQSKDGGCTWQALAGPRVPGWLAGDFKDAEHGALAGPWARLGTLRREGFKKADVDKLGERNLRGVHMADQRTIAVGQGGLVLTSANAGVSYGFPDLKLSAEVLQALDFHCVHRAGDHVWVAGRPGSVLLHSPKQGADSTWRLVPTGQPLPLNGIFFFDEKRGWAVGEYGTILATEDGGQKWAVQQRGGQRAAVLFVNARPTDCPLDTLAVLGVEEGNLTTALRVTAADGRSGAFNRASDAQRFGAAVRQAGGGSGELLWQFPVAQHLANADKKELLNHWNELHGGDAEKQLVRQLVLALRMWRPDVVVVDQPVGNAAGALVGEALHQAFALAADPKAYPEQIEKLGLSAWVVSKVYSLWDKRQDAQVTVDGATDQPRLATNAREFAAGPAGLLAESPISLPAERHYRLIDNRIDGAAGKPHLLAGVPATPTGVCRRNLGPVAEPQPEVAKAVRAVRNLRTLVETQGGGLADADKLLAQMAPALKHLPEDFGVAALHGMASQYAERGQWLLAREAFLLLVDRFPNHARAADAYRWLVRHNSSSEAKRRGELNHFLKVAATAFPKELLENPDPKLPPPGGVVSADGKGQFNPSSVQQARDTFLTNQAESREWYRGSLEIAKKLNTLGPLFATDPPMLFCVQAARRQLLQVQQLHQAQEWYASFQMSQKDGPWHDAAAQELWLLRQFGPPPRPVAVCRQAAQKPYLDGNFDDDCWKNTQPFALQNAVQNTAKDYPTEARLGYDEKYLYLAVRCQHPKGRQVAPVQERPRDADLRPFDHVSLLLDLDRDYSTYFRLEIDQRGCVREDCWGDRSWNPKWFVAVRSDEDGWQVEAAIPLIELTGQAVNGKTAWACNVVRTLPGRGVQALSVPADVEPRPEGMGLLLFHPSDAVPAQPAPKMHPATP